VGLQQAFQVVKQALIGLRKKGQDPQIPDEAVKLYRMMAQLLPRVLKEHVEPAALATAQRQCRVAARKLEEVEERRQDDAARRRPRLYDGLSAEQ
jgi:hypothetical protein